MPDDPGRKPKTHYQDNDHPIDFMDDVLEIGDTDQHGHMHPNHKEYEREMERRYIGTDKPKIEFHDDANEIDGLGRVPF